MGNLFIRDVFIPEAGLLTVTQVKVTDDLRLAKVYVSFLENKIPVEDVLKILGAKRNLIRFHLGNKLLLRFVPQFKFIYDDTLEQAQHIEELIVKIHKND